MCKVLIIPAISPNKKKETLNFIHAMGSKMSLGNSDGLGYAAINAQGDLFGERWFTNNEAFKKPVLEKDFTALKETADKNVSQFGKALKHYKIGGWTKEKEVEKYNKFGEDVVMNASAITLHTRMATCEKTLVNVHPFVDNIMDTSVIHNGVIHNSKNFDLKLSTCDSESILISYLENEVNFDINNVQKMSEQLEGYYACGVFSRDGQGNRILDVFKQNNNMLSIAYIFELETYVIASSDQDIKNVCDVLGYTHDGTQDFHDEMITRINPFTGEIICQAEFKKKVTHYNSYNQSNYMGYDNWSERNGYHSRNHSHYTASRNVTQIEHGKGKIQKIIDAHHAKMLELKSDLKELGEREVQEFTAAMGE